MTAVQLNNVVVCSVIIKPIRNIIQKLLPKKLSDIALGWSLDWDKIPRHTFVASLPFIAQNPVGYWYCAGDFIGIDEPGVRQEIMGVDHDLAKCLVNPDIDLNHPLHNKKVIGGIFKIHYVCHNIVNRILFANPKPKTLLDLPFPIGGYSYTLKSPLGVYGQNEVEWLARREKCLGLNDNYDPKIHTPISRHDEIHRLHLRATGSEEKARNLTDALATIDNEFYRKTSLILEELDRKVDLHEKFKILDPKEDPLIKVYQKFDDDMSATVSELFSNTIKEIGLATAKKIYEGCTLEEQTPIEIPVDILKSVKKGQA